MAIVSIIWHGHSSFSIDVDGVRLVVDPFFAPHNPAAKKTVEEISADFILQTHGHGDHIASTIPLAKRTGAKVIANFEIANWLNKHGVANTHGQQPGGGYQHPFGHVKMTAAVHSSGLPDGADGGIAGGFLLTIAEYRIYIAGDTALFSDMALIGRNGIDVAILPIGDNFTMGPEDAFFAVELLKPRVVIPAHYNTWPLIAVDADAWCARVNAETTTKAIKLAVEEGYTLP